MSELKQGTMIKLTNGGQVKVQKELGRGGQGIVYLCEFNGQQYALKWYIQHYPDTFYNNLKTNVQNQAPNGSKAFLWPLMITEKQHDSFGYVMDLRPDGYYEFGAFLKNKVKFKTISAMLNCAVDICAGFQALHQAGLSYQDLNEGNFFVNPENGHVLICDNDNVTPPGYNLGIKGKPRYMAPEVVIDARKPDVYSDCFSLAIILFRLFFTDHPLEGKRHLSVPLMSPSFARKIYGKEPIFIFDPNIDLNRPVPNVHKNSIKLWPLYPSLLKNAFVKAFSQDSIKNPSDFNKRPNLREWQKTVVALRNSLIMDEKGKESWLKDGEFPKVALKTSEGMIFLSPKKTIYLGTNNQPVGQVMFKSDEPNVWIIKNLSSVPWRVITPTGNQVSVEPNGMMPVNKGLKINLPNNEQTEII
ncbi:serine/threonine protein kinase [Psychroflexus salis]|uniref:Protein kinase domain-containing protein n=1 Tax=Psychroflexus salis TaxID=1526574 RepID=A0A916ZV43_9FLAO|nr:serine/threonine-protein kinase [Psychroflexus salis]GGE15604.1 hypothetical protein GCM10010831_16150 [Psychroflexus salis]